MKNRFYLSSALVALFCLAAWTTHAQLQRSNAARQNWEYKLLVFSIDGPRTILYEDGKQLPGAPTPITKSGELGAQGWELISVSAVSHGNYLHYAYWFKRAK